MVVRGLTDGAPTVDDVAIRFQSVPNKYMFIGELLTALRSYGLQADYKRPLYVGEAMGMIQAGQPVIALVKYPLLPFQFSTFTGSHFIVLYGVVGDSLLYRDPLATNDNKLAITSSELDEAMSGFDAGENLPYQGILCGA